jgi:glutamyl-tRNA synthetase
MALFDYVWARQQGGRFMVRIEDTDRSRFNPQSEQRILQSLRWLGLQYDEGPDIGGPNAPYHQSQRLELYHRYADQLLELGCAYRAFETPEELERIRRELDGKGQRRGYDGRGRALPQEESDRRARAGEPFAVRLRAPDSGITVVRDQLRGPVRFDNAGLEDTILLKSDGYPTYHLAVVIDDHLAGVSDVLRGEEWLSSAAIHVLLYGALDWEQPNWYHLPLLRNPDHSKLSKRSGHTSLEWFRGQGVLPEALCNYLALMGFSMPDGRELFSLEQLIEAFSWRRFSLSGPVFDLQKLLWLNGKYIREVLEVTELERRLAGFGAERGWQPYPTFARVVELMRPRISTLLEFWERTRYFYAEDYPVTEAAAALVADSGPLLEEALAALRQLRPFSAEAAEAALRDLAQRQGRKLGQLVQPLRAALCGATETPGMFEILELLGPELTERRLERAVAGTHGLV